MGRRGFPAGVFEDAVRGVLGAVKEVVPTDAQLHLLAAQRELILAVAAVIEHHTEGGGEEVADSLDASPAGTAAKGGARRRGRTKAPRPTRVSLD